MNIQRLWKHTMEVDEQIDRLFYRAGWCMIGMAACYCFGKQMFGWQLHLPACPVRTVLGLYCPGCGGTRAVLALAKGKLWESFCMHPFVPYVFVVGGYFMVSQTIARIVRKIKRKCMTEIYVMHFRLLYIWCALLLVAVHFIANNAMLLANY